MFFSFIPFLIIAAIILFSTFKILDEFERGVIFRLGKFSGVRGPGLIILIPGLEKMVKVDLRLVTMDVPAQDIISKDNVTLKVNAVVYFKVSSPENAIISVENYYHATAQIAQTTLRSVVGQYELDEILAHRDAINTKLQGILDEVTEPWGIKVSNVEVKAIDLPVEMQRAMAKQAEAEREKRAKIIAAEGEYASAKKLAEAAQVLGEQKDAITLRYLETMREVASCNNSSTTIFPIPVDFLSRLMTKN
jgi:regulator of protease activity HflC (stomatin/prohibitin superfamily)